MEIMSQSPFLTTSPNICRINIVLILIYNFRHRAPIDYKIYQDEQKSMHKINDNE